MKKLALHVLKLEKNGMKDEDRVYVEALDFGALLGLVDQCLEKGFRIPIERIKLRE